MIRIIIRISIQTGIQISEKHFTLWNSKQHKE